MMQAKEGFAPVEFCFTKLLRRYRLVPQAIKEKWDFLFLDEFRLAHGPCFQERTSHYLQLRLKHHKLS